MHVLHSGYEEFKGRVITYIKSKNTTKVALGSHMVRIDEPANVIFLDHSDGEKIIL